MVELDDVLVMPLDVEVDVDVLVEVGIPPVLVVVSSPQPIHADAESPKTAAQAATVRPEPPKAENQLLMCHLCNAK